ncbi:MAG: SusC/RagA family TonB-linked outer membrane protein [Mucilaginibacter sp.]|uniref:carboxypeptidase-like regulatory domain-containing protein n=1 Tax=Mucilaginibacter sp. TaxID=1882438 RepID=UPI002615652C|nr:carboxypeptidase-like regulatory domain-containing protein [Mucilaginibacter sp.]MDB5002761.1 SusC/RagA family TonB-linked outer membrane protein [Mucilaginibacter sp.]
MSAKDPNIAKIGKYLKGQLDARAMHSVEREAQDDPFLMDALEGYEITGKDQERNLIELKERLANRIASQKERSILLWRVLPIAACLLIMFGAGYWFFSAVPDKVQYANVVKPDISIKKTDTIIKPSSPIAKANVKSIASKKPDLKSPDLIAANKITVSRTDLPLIVRDTTKLVADNLAINISKEVQDHPVGNVENLLQGKVAGQNTQRNYFGALGQRGSVNIRGLSGDSTNTNYTYKAPATKPVFGSQLSFYGSKASPTTNMITGKILDVATREPLAATTVGIPGKGLTQADINGKYSVVVNDTATLVFTYQGYVPQTIKLKPGQKNLNINLIADNKNPSGTVIRGYVKRKSDETKGVSYIITGKEVQDNPVGNVDQLLQGKVAGLNIQNRASIKNSLVTITGKVTNKDGAPIQGVRIGTLAKGFAQSDTGGRYRIVANIDSPLTFVSLGYRTQSVKLNQGQATADIKLEEQQNQLAEVSVHGYVKRSRDQTTGASYIITGKEKPCKENARFKRRFFKKITIAEQYVSEHANEDSASIKIKGGKFLRALKFIKKRVPVSFPTDKTVIGYSDLKTFSQNKSEWLKWYEANKCNDLK